MYNLLNKWEKREPSPRPGLSYKQGWDGREG